jgi:hypothetical protein
MVRLITNFAKFALKQTWIAIRFSTPWVIRFLIFTSGVSVKLSIVAVSSMFRGVDTVAQTIALDWQKRAVAGGFPSLWERHLYHAYYVLAICTIFTGWMVIAFTGVLAVVVSVNLIF